jgi:hypothetical protein
MARVPHPGPGAPEIAIEESDLVWAVIQCVNRTFRWTEAEVLARFEAPLIAAGVLRLLLAETSQIERAANLGTIKALVQHLSHQTQDLSF